MKAVEGGSDDKMEEDGTMNPVVPAFWPEVLCAVLALARFAGGLSGEGVGEADRARFAGRVFEADVVVLGGVTSPVVPPDF